ncbi:MAG: creatininase family protein [Firmicutes bacterium]|nr:creatininase family protein [Bacillota bacterium]
MAEKRYLLAEMTWPEVKKALETVEVAVIPVGANEQHGPHLATSCDAVRAYEFSKLLAERMFPKVLVTPPVNFGISYHHLCFPGTISLHPQTLISIIKDIVKSLKTYGIKKFFILNSHGGNDTTLDVACTIIEQEVEGVKVGFVKYTSLAKESIQKHVKSPDYGHSCEREVSEILYLKPEIFKPDALAKGDLKTHPCRHTSANRGPIGLPYEFNLRTGNGCLGDATKASREIGKEICDEALEKLAEFLDDFIRLEM